MIKPDRQKQKIRAEALAAIGRGEHRQALAKLAALESLDPDEPDWPRRAAECHRALGDSAQQLAALGRAATLYVHAQMPVKALAICRIMLGVDAQHAVALSWMKQLAAPAPATTIRRPLVVKRRPSGSARARTSHAPPANPARRLAADRGLIAVARARALAAQAAPVQGRAANPATTPPPAPPSLPANNSWQVVADDELLQTEAPPPVAPPFSLPPLSSDAIRLRELVPGSVSLPGGDGGPSGLFRLSIDGDLQLRAERARRQVREVLPAVPLFSEIDPRSLEGLVRQSRFLQFAPGQVVFKQDDPPDCLYVVVNGSVAFFDEAASRVELYRLGENEFFGEAALISNEPCHATVEACEPCDLMAFDREAVKACIAKNPAVVPVLLRFLRARMIEHLVRTSPLFTGFDTAERRMLSRRFEFIEMEQGSLLIQQGARSPGLFALLSGQVDVLRREPTREYHLATLKRGGVFGEISLLGRVAAVADVLCASAGFALLLPAPEFHEVIMTHPQFLEVVTSLSEQRREANQALIGSAG